MRWDRPALAPLLDRDESGLAQDLGPGAWPGSYFLVGNGFGKQTILLAWRRQAYVLLLHHQDSM